MNYASVDPLSAKEARIQTAANEAYRVLEGQESAPTNPRERLLDILRNATREAPLHALALAFIFGVMAARRR